MIKLIHKHFETLVSCNRHLKIKFLSHTKHFCLGCKDHPANAVERNVFCELYAIHVVHERSLEFLVVEQVVNTVTTVL